MIRVPVALLAAALAAPPVAAEGEGVPDALSVEWQGRKPCERLYEDEQIRIARCTFPPGAVHVRHSHPGYLTYVLSGGKGQNRDEKGTRDVEIRTDTLRQHPPIPWHEFTDVGDTTIRYVVIERKYEPVETATGK